MVQKWSEMFRQMVQMRPVIPTPNCQIENSENCQKITKNGQNDPKMAKNTFLTYIWYFFVFFKIVFLLLNRHITLFRSHIECSLTKFGFYNKTNILYQNN